MSKVQVCFIVFIGSWLCAIGLIVLVELDAIAGLPQPLARGVAAMIAGLSVVATCGLYLWSLRDEKSYSKDLLDDAIADQLHTARVLQESKDRLAAVRQERETMVATAKALHNQRIAAIKAHYAQN